MQGEHLRPGGELAGQRDDGAPDPVLVQVVQGQVGQPGVLRGADAVLGAGPAAVAQFEVGELAAGPAGAGVGGERGQPVAVAVGQAQLRAGVRALAAHDHPHPGRPAGQVEQPGDLDDRGAGAGFAVGVVGRLPGASRGSREIAATVSGRVNPTE